MAFSKTSSMAQKYDDKWACASVRVKLIGHGGLADTYKYPHLSRVFFNPCLKIVGLLLYILADVSAKDGVLTLKVLVTTIDA